MGAMASQTTGASIVNPTVYSGAHYRKHQRVTGLCEENSPVNSPHKGPVTRKMFPFYDVIMLQHSEQRIWLDYQLLFKTAVVKIA